MRVPIEEWPMTQLRNEKKDLVKERSLESGPEKLPALRPGRGTDLVPELGALKARHGVKVRVVARMDKVGGCEGRSDAGNEWWV